MAIQSAELDIADFIAKLAVCPLTKWQEMFEARDDAIRAEEPAQQIAREITEIMAVYDEQTASMGYVDTPGGLEHMGDVWRLLDRWREMIRARAPAPARSLAPGYRLEKMSDAEQALLAEKAADRREG